MSLRIDPSSISPGEARWDHERHVHSWEYANNIIGPPFAECLCGATADLNETDTAWMKWREGQEQ